MDYFKPAAELMKASFEKYGLWPTIVAFILLFSVPALAWKLPEIIQALK